MARSWQFATVLAVGLLVGSAGVALAETSMLDEDFGDGGVTHFAPESKNAWSHSLEVLDDGTILVGGAVGSLPGSLELGLTRLQSDGSLDPSFGAGGHVAFEPPDAWSTSFWGMAVDAQDRPVVLARAGLFGEEIKVAVARRQPDGGPDPTFGDDGFVQFPNPDSDNFATTPDDVIVDADNRIVVTAGNWLVRLDEDGSMDESFGDDGVVRHPDFPNVGERRPVGSTLALQDDGAILVASAGGGVPRIHRYTPSGEFDTSFGDAGTVAAPLERHSEGTTRATVLVPGEDEIVLITRGDDGDSSVLMAYGYFADGSPDSAYGSSSDNWVEVSELQQVGSPRAAVHPDAGVVVGGMLSQATWDPPTRMVRVVRLTGSGEVDVSLGASGVREAEGVMTYANDLAVEADGSVLVAGSGGDTMLAAGSGGDTVLVADSGGHDDAEYDPLAVARFTAEETAPEPEPEPEPEPDPEPEPEEFTDVAGTTHEESIGALVEAGITGGFEDGTFRPGQAVTRGQMATFLVNALDLPDGAAPFDDVAGTTHEESIGALVEAGITGGFEDGTFRPGQAVTRGQMATFLVNALDLPEGAAPFDDVAGTTHEESIGALVEAGITGGFEDGTFRPGQAVTRGQMATFLVNGLDL